MTEPSRSLRLAAPCCGSCGYDATGLTTLICPECGSDLRVAGITRGQARRSFGGFFVSALGLTFAWVISGMMGVSAVTALVPERWHVQHTVRLGGPRSGVYQAVDVVASGTGWGDARPSMNVELRLVVPATGSPPATAMAAPPTSRPAPPAPLRTGPGVGKAGVLTWMGAAGIDVTDPRVIEEAQAVALAALRGARTRERISPGAVLSRSTSMSGGSEGPFSSVSMTIGGSTDRTTLHLALFAALWLTVLAAGLAYLWRSSRPRSPAPS